MSATSELTVRALDVGDVGTYLRHVRVVDAGSGVDGAAHSHPYERDEPFDVDAAHDREVTRWTTTLDAPGWRRAWGLFAGEELVGHLYLGGGMLRSELHRVSLGMGIVSGHRGVGGGTLLLRTAIMWARDQPGIAWVDLGVFSDNPRAQALYARIGFETIGHTRDRFRVDGHSLDDTAMTLNVVGDA